MTTISAANSSEPSRPQNASMKATSRPPAPALLTVRPAGAFAAGVFEHRLLGVDEVGPLESLLAALPTSGTESEPTVPVLAEHAAHRRCPWPRG